MSSIPQEPLAETLFETLILSLAASALSYLGESKEAPQGPVNFSIAQQSIELIGMLHEKTRGNLTLNEQSFLETILYDLRLKFMQKTTPPIRP